MGNNTSDYDVMLMVIMPTPRVDSLYHYNNAKNRLEARFTVEYANKDKIPWHGYSEYPRHFIGDVSFPVQMSKNTWGSTKPAKYIVDKKTLHGNYFHLYNDFLGTKEMQIWPSFGNGYYVSNMEPSQLKETLEKELARKDLPSTVRKRTQALVKSLNEDNNNVVLFAKMKK